MNFIGKLLFIFCLFFLIVILFYTAIYFPAEEDSLVKKVINIPSGTNAAEIANVLEKNYIIKNNVIFKTFIRLYRLEDKLKYGEYILSPSMNMFQISDILVRGRVLRHKITIPEGYNYKQIAELLEKQEIVEKDSFINLVKNQEKSWEGYLFPDTYEVPKNYGSKNMLETFLTNFNRVIEENKIRESAEEKGFSMNKILTLASIIEKEAKTYKEKSLVSSVFHNRLKINMKLQSCATIQYILGKPKEKLDESDLKIESPYNTYLNTGLPPGPICNPGLDSIRAALKPSEEDYLYFVLGDNGNHIFSNTYKEHLKNKNNK